MFSSPPTWLLVLSATAVLVSAEDVHYEWTIQSRLSVPPLSPDCYTDRDLMLVNDQFPGPILRANVGDKVHIKWHNEHPSEGVSIHYHGLLMQDQPYADGTGGVSTCVVGPRQTFEHTFVADNAGTHYWHGHTSLDRMDGLQGLIVIEDPNDPEEQALKGMYDEERVLFLQDWYHKGGSSLRNSEFVGFFLVCVYYSLLWLEIFD
jgi:FtsP/CotA-like multicopper oxidase with cupredoxin domain